MLGKAQIDCGEGFDRGNLSALLDVLKDGIRREEGNAERLDAKTRQLLAFLGVLFAVVQALAFGSYRQGLLSGHERVAIAVLAFAAAVLLTAAALASFRQQSALTVVDLNLEDLGRVIDKPGDGNFLARLCRDHLAILWSRREANYIRRNRYQLAFLVSVPTVVVLAAELIVSVAARID